MSRQTLFFSALVFFFFGCAGPDNVPEMPEGRTEGPPPAESEAVVSKSGHVDCARRADTGYESGRAFSITVIHVDGKPVELETADAYLAMRDAAAANGIRLRIVSGFRTHGEQSYLYACYVHCDCNNCNLAAYPGYSNHQSGSALDLNTSDHGVQWWLNTYAGRHGFRRTVPSEPWHWEYVGGGPSGAGACGAGPAEDGVSGGASGGAGTYSVPSGGSCWGAAEALGCGIDELHNCTASGRGCAGLWAGDVLACGAAACSGPAAATPEAEADPAPTCQRYTAPAGSSCGQVARALDCPGQQVNCSAGVAGCGELWAGDTLACGWGCCP